VVEEKMMKENLVPVENQLKNEKLPKL